MLSDESESLDNESDKFGSEFGSSGMYSFFVFPLYAEEPVAGVFVFDIFAPTGVEYIIGIIISILLLLL